MVETELIEETMNIIKGKKEFIDCIKMNNSDEGFLFSTDETVIEIKNAMYENNPCHSASSLAICLSKCKSLLNN
jgi:hypothetical protein